MGPCLITKLLKFNSLNLPNLTLKLKEFESWKLFVRPLYSMSRERLGAVPLYDRTNLI